MCFRSRYHTPLIFLTKRIKTIKYDKYVIFFNSSIMYNKGLSYEDFQIVAQHELHQHQMVHNIICTTIVASG